jgi:hypothetical protein
MLAALAAIALAQSDATDLLFTKSKLTRRDWAEVANAYIELGEEQACATLLQGSSAHSKGKGNVRAGLICRILFQGKGGPLRSPKFGELSLPRMSLSAWPEYPLLQEDKVWFLLDENYRPGGKQEAAADYVDYCRKTGQFRKEKLTVPTAEEARNAWKDIQGAKRWSAIRWADSDLRSNYTYDRGWTVEMLRSQTRFTGG